MKRFSDAVSVSSGGMGGFVTAINSLIENVKKKYEDLPKRMQEAVMLLGQHGWYLDLGMQTNVLFQLKDSLENGNLEEAEAALMQHFERRLPEIEADIMKLFPNRAHIIKSAFSAHRKREYELSIPVLLAQVDGICYEVVGKYLFMSTNKKPDTASYVAKLTEQEVATARFRTAILRPLAEKLPIGQTQGERGEDFNDLNRHMVLHGECLDYGTEKNGLKGISLINYVAHALKE